jgi:hypothetical protein
MTEHEWDRCTDPRPMLAFLQGKAGERKLRLFACACGRRVWHQLRYEDSRRAVDVAERFADGIATREELARTREAAANAANPYHEEGGDDQAGWACAYAASPTGSDCGLLCASSFCNSGPLEERRALFRTRSGPWDTSLSRVAAGLIREIFGNPLRPVQVDPAWLPWRGGAIVNLAQAVYEERELPSGHLDAARLAVLADMLEEAGCCDAGLLGHLRSPGPHVRGCWPLDLLLQKA